MKKTSTILIVCLLFFLVGGCVTVPWYEKDEFAFTKKWADGRWYTIGVAEKEKEYFRRQYARASKDEPFYAADAISNGSLLSAKWILNRFSSKVTDAKTFLLDCAPLRKRLKSIFNYYSLIWRQAIHDHVEYPSLYVDFSEALAIVLHEFRRVGLFDEINDYQNNLSKIISNLPKDKYPSTYELYSVTVQLFSIAKNPTGSLYTFNATTNKLLLEHERLEALAAIELKK